MISEWIYTLSADIQFTVNTGVFSVDIVPAPATTKAIFYNASGNKRFIAGEQIFIEQAVCLYPLQFCQGDLTTPITFALHWNTFTSMAQGQVPEVGDDGIARIPLSNTYTPINANIDNKYFPLTPERNTEDYELSVEMIAVPLEMGGTVSMVGVPAILNNQVFHPRFGLLVRHNNFMV